MESSSSTNDKVILLLVEEVILVFEVFQFLKLFIDNKRHVTITQHDWAMKKDPSVVLAVKYVTFVQIELLRCIWMPDLIVDCLNIKALKHCSLWSKIDSVLLCWVDISFATPEDPGLFSMVKRFNLNVFLNIPNRKKVWCFWLHHSNGYFVTMATRPHFPYLCQFIFRGNVEAKSLNLVLKQASVPDLTWVPEEDVMIVHRETIHTFAKLWVAAWHEDTNVCSFILSYLCLS